MLGREEPETPAWEWAAKGRTQLTHHAPQVQVFGRVQLAVHEQGELLLHHREIVHLGTGTVPAPAEPPLPPAPCLCPLPAPPEPHSLYLRVQRAVQAGDVHPMGPPVCHWLGGEGEDIGAGAQLVA